MLDEYRSWVTRIAERVLLEKFRAGVSREELVAAGMVGLWQAWKRWDPARGVKLATYVTPRVLGAMYDHLREMAPGTRGNPQPRPVSLDAPRVYDDGGRPVNLYDELVESADGAGAGLDRDDFWRGVLKRLRWPLNYVVLRYYRDGMTLRQIGGELCLCESRVSQMHGEAIGLLRETSFGGEHAVFDARAGRDGRDRRAGDGARRADPWQQQEGGAGHRGAAGGVGRRPLISGEDP